MKKISILLIFLIVLSVGLLSGYYTFITSYNSDYLIGFRSKKLVRTEDSFPIDLDLPALDSGMMYIDDSLITNGINDQNNPAITYGSQVDEYLVVWEDKFTFDNHDIYGCRIANDGMPIGNEISIAVSSLDEEKPAITYNPDDNEYLIIWRTRIEDEAWIISGRRLSSNGNLIGDEFNITTDLGGYPDVTYNSVNNEYLIVWEQYDFGFYHIYGQRLDKLGFLIGSPLIIGTGTNHQSNPAIAYSPVNNLYLIVWEDKPHLHPYDSLNISGQLVRYDGGLYGNKITISTWEYAQIKPRLAFNNVMNEFLVVWEDHHWGWGDARDIYGQRVNSDGVLIGGNFPVSWEGVNLRLNPDIIYSSRADEYLVTWEYENTASDHDIYCRRIGSDGTLIEGEKKISSSNISESRPSLASDNDLTYFIVWEDNRDTVTQGINIYGNLMNLDRISGYVFSGNIGDESTPISGVTVELYCSNDIDVLGDLIDSTVTDSNGWYGFIITDICEFYNILETDFLDYTSMGAMSEDGTLVTKNHIQYEYPLDNKTLSGNKFWDYIEGESSLVDLVISDIWYEDDTIWYQIKNIGNESAPGGYYTALFVDDVYILSDFVTIELESGAQWNGFFDYNWNCTSPDDKVEIIADYNNDVAEYNGVNNNRIENLDCNNPPFQPSNPNPSNHTTEENITVNFEWLGGDPNGDDVKYDVYFGTTNPPPLVIGNHTETYYNPGKLNISTVYYWKIVAWDPYGLKNESDIWMFSTGNKPLSPTDSFDAIIIVLIIICGGGIIYAIKKYPPKNKRIDKENEDDDKEEEEELEADAGDEYEAKVKETIQFNGSAKGGKVPYIWYWDLGDGTNSTEKNPEHAYNTKGNYTATLTVTDSKGNTATDTATIEIEEKTDYLISGVKYDTKHSHIVKVKTHEYKNNKIRKSYVIEDRKTVLKNLHNKKIYHTAIKDKYGKWLKGEKIKIIKIKNKDFLRTDNNKTEIDNLEELPEF